MANNRRKVIANRVTMQHQYLIRVKIIFNNNEHVLRRIKIFLRTIETSG